MPRAKPKAPEKHFHLWKLNDRKNAYFRLSNVEHWQYGGVTAAFPNRSIANQYANKLKKAGKSIKVFECDDTTCKRHRESPLNVKGGGIYSGLK